MTVILTLKGDNMKKQQLTVCENMEELIKKVTDQMNIKTDDIIGFKLGDKYVVVRNRPKTALERHNLYIEKKHGKTTKKVTKKAKTKSKRGK